MGSFSDPETNGITKSQIHEELRESLHIVDNRTGAYYNVPITHNSINASEFKRMKAPENRKYYADQCESGIRIFDPGFSNTAVSESKITYM